jgi:4-amino-4-deoxy-L-arabinose transferase-like glycosyltransferase
MRSVSLGGVTEPRAQIRSGSFGLSGTRLGVLATGALLTSVFVLVRLALALTSTLRETYYDEALTGLMALDILRGIPQVFYWGEPYGGAIGDAYLAAAGFWLFGPSTLVLRLSPLAVIVVSVWAAWLTARRTAGERFGLWSGFYLVIPPVFLSFVQLSSSGEAVAVACGAVVVAATIRLLDRDLSPRSDAVAWMVTGVAAGVGWWASQIMGMFVVTAVLALAIARPRAWRTAGLYIALGLFLLSSLPFWIWNLEHDWATFRHLAAWGGGPAPLHEGVPTVTRALAATLLDRYWDGSGHDVSLPKAGTWLGRALLLTVYAPAVALALAQAGIWIRRAWGRERPWREPLDVVVLAFWLTVAAHLATWFGTSGVLRYSITFYVTLPVLCATLLARLSRVGRIGRVLATALAAAVLAYNALTHVAFLEGSRAAPTRPVDTLISRLDGLGVRACYADARIAQVITFESSERIRCSDYRGYRHFGLLQAVDAIEDPARVAIVTHRVLQEPRPAVMAKTLRLAGAEMTRDVVGDYVVFHHFAAPDPRIEPVPVAGWHARASSVAESADLAFDRRVWTRWTAPKRADEWLELDLGRLRRITQVSLLAAPWATEAPSGLRVATSTDGRSWEAGVEAADLYPGAHWWQGHPRVDDSGRVIVRFSPREARYVRITSLGAEVPGRTWSVAELFVYEVAAAPWLPPPAATAALAAGTRELDHWRNDPTGPHPQRAPVTIGHRRAQVPWGRVFASANAALAAAPDWEAVHHLHGLALARSGWGDGLENALGRAHADGAWHEVIHAAELMDGAPEAGWRAGRLAAWVEALEQLGRPAEAAAIRARPEPAPVRAVRVLFGPDLELWGIDGPREARAGDTVELSYYWRLLDTTAYDYWVFCHLPGLPGSEGSDQPVGPPGYPLSRWADGERVRQTVTFTVPADTPPGVYPLRVGVWLPSTGRRLRILASDLPQARRAVTVGTLVVR